MFDVVPEISYTIHIKNFFLLFYLAWIISTTVSSRLMTVTQDHHNLAFSSATQSCPILCDPMDFSTPDFPVYHQLPELTQTHVHRVNDAIQPSHPLLSPSLPPSIFPSIRVFSDESVICIRWPKYWSFSFSISPSNEIFRTDFL